METLLPRLGVDFGGVIHGVTYVAGGPDTFLQGTLGAALETPAMPGAIESLARLTKLFGGRVWIVSKCGPRVQSLTEQWLEHHDFFSKTGVDSSHLRFVRQRTDKATRCLELGITHFVDDRSDVLESMLGVVEHLFMFASRGGEAPPSANRAEDWATIESQIAGTIV